MYPKKRNRLISLTLTLISVALGVSIILYNIRDNIIYFYPPTEIIARTDLSHTKIRLGGVVKSGSVQYKPNQTTEFIITDYQSEMKVIYQGILPALFREKQGIIAEGKLEHKDLFIAHTLLAKHDENYRPPSVVQKD